MTINVALNAYAYPFEYNSELPDEIIHNLVPAVERFFGKSTNGYVLHQCIEETSDYSVWYNEWQIETADQIKVASRDGMIVLHFQLRNRLCIDIPGARSYDILQEQICLLFQPVLNQVFTIRPHEKYVFLDIVMSQKFIQLFCPYFNVIDRFVSGITAESSSIVQNATKTNSQIKYMLDRIFNCSYTGDLRTHYINARLFDLVIAVFEATPGVSLPQKEFRISRAEKERIHEVQQLLLKNPGKIFSIAELSRWAYMNQFKLRKGFQQEVGMSIFDFQQQLRMNTAKESITSGNGSLDDIATNSGYQHVSSFLKAFKGYFGVTPRNLRRR
ncbi:AraC family transcriptional regulator [Chitinophaga varians]|uniref:AraC family transcriptional regulator n=1 Tax=Chitinophaga varians TaxID=2202339 RepID=A0A847S376_9BACT|nr:AraC family transcriptional regulator [Chitinophaga varians]NLR67885.1 AraC family transcriptional regulator [Chitinophaga varians]